MRHVKTLLILLFTVLFACGGSGETISDDPPDVAGSYNCVNGCSGVCTFDDNLTVLQNGSNVIIRSDNFSDATGTINDDGEFITTSDDCECEGTIIGGTAVASCECSGTTCQSATFVD